MTTITKGTRFQVQTTNGPVVKEIFEASRFGYKACDLRDIGSDVMDIGFEWYGREYFEQAVADKAIEIL